MKKLLALALLAPAAAAQVPVQLNARIEPVQLPTICPGFQFRVDSANVFLTSDALDLSEFVGHTQLLVGTDLSSPLCPVAVVSVDEVLPPTATLEACGTPRPGCTLALRVGPPTVSTNLLLAAVGTTAFFNLGDPLGVLLLNPPLLFAGDAGPNELIEVQIPPGAPVGLLVTFQALHVDVGPVQGPGSLSNPVGFTLLPLGQLCIDPGSCF